MPPKSQMILSSLLILLLLAIFGTACDKGGERAPIKDVTGYVWKLGALQEAADPYISPLFGNWQLVLGEDRKFTVYVDGSSCYGTYTWTEIDSLSANIDFTIKQWKVPTQYAGSAQKVKDVLSGINRCYILKGINVPPLLRGFTNPTIALDLEGNNGYFYWYR